MGTMASQITSLMIVYSTVYSSADQRTNQSSTSLACVRGAHRWPGVSPHKVPETRKVFPFDDVIMYVMQGRCSDHISEYSEDKTNIFFNCLQNQMMTQTHTVKTSMKFIETLMINCKHKIRFQNILEGFQSVRLCPCRRQQAITWVNVDKVFENYIFENTATLSENNEFWAHLLIIFSTCSRTKYTERLDTLTQKQVPQTYSNCSSNVTSLEWQ